MKLNIAAMVAKQQAVVMPDSQQLPPHSAATERHVESVVRSADAAIAASDSVVDGLPPEPNVRDAPESNIKGQTKLSRLVDDDFPFDESQLTAIYGISKEQYACLTGAAGTGKTTSTKKIVDLLQDGLCEVDMSGYWKRGDSAADADDEYEAPEDFIPGIALVSFTGRATQMIKKNFPRDWHGNIMTIHRLLGFVPDFYEDFDPESGEMRKKMRFIPSYNEYNRMPWDIIVIDEAGMLGLDLWHQLYAAMKPGCRIVMIGDINQLPPTHGKSVFGFAMSNWPSWELTHVHRQQGANNSIVDNAHRILKGLTPVSDCPDKTASLRDNKSALAALNFMAKDKDWRFAMFEVDEDSRKASYMIRSVMKLLQGKLYEPNRDAIITPINGYESTATGYMLGQDPLNRELAITLNAGQSRFLIDAGRERRNFAIGDKVMATRNDYEAGITNGMTGIVESINAHGQYQGDHRRWGRIEDVNEYLREIDEGKDDSHEDEDFSFEDLESAAEEQEAGAESKKEGRDRGPASHIVTVRFGEGEHSFTIAFQSLAEVASLQLAYAVTCHKMQGGEAPFIAVILHQSHKRPLNREWFYTAVTRASHRCVVFYTKQGRGFALTKQNIKGATLKQKIEAFQAWQKIGLVGATVNVKLPKSESKQLAMYQAPATPTAAVGGGGTKAIAEAPAESNVQRMIREQREKTVKEVNHIHIHLHEASTAPKVESAPVTREVKDGGDFKREEPKENPFKFKLSEAAKQINLDRQAAMLKRIAGPLAALPKPQPVLRSTLGAVRMMHKLEDSQATLLLTHQPSPEPAKPALPKGLAALIAAQRATKEK